MLSKQFAFQVKSLTTEGTFSGLASVFGNTDLGGDVVEHGAFARTLSHKGGQVPILWQHDTRVPIGLGKLVETAKGLEVTGELVMEASKAREAYALLKKGVLRGLSIGYDVIDFAMHEGKRHLKELKLWEVSIVTFPMNELATISSVKTSDVMAEQIRLFRETLRQAEKSLRR